VIVIALIGAAGQASAIIDRSECYDAGGVVARRVLAMDAAPRGREAPLQDETATVTPRWTSCRRPSTEECADDL